MLPAGPRVQNDTVSPLFIVICGVIIQLLMSPTPLVLLKLAPM